jgi:hypothetical protein
MIPPSRAPLPFSAEDREAANILLSLRSSSARDGSSRESCPSAACAVCACGGRRVTRSQMYEEAGEEDYSDMPALIPIETPRFRRLADAEAEADARSTAIEPLEAVKVGARRLPRLAVLRAMSDRSFETFLARLDDSELEAVRRTSDYALASDANLSREQRATLLEEIRERSSDDSRAFTARRKRAMRMR